MRLTNIGNINKGIDGTDQYVLVENVEGDNLDLDTVHENLLDMYYRDCCVPGGYFCKTVQIIPDPVHSRKCIAVIQHRYDV